MENQNKHSNKVEKNSYMRFMGLGFEILASIVLGAYLGNKLDDYLQTEQPYMTIIFILLFLSASFYHLIKSVSKMP